MLKPTAVSTHAQAELRAASGRRFSGTVWCVTPLFMGQGVAQKVASASGTAHMTTATADVHAGMVSSTGTSTRAASTNATVGAAGYVADGSTHA